MQVTETEIIIPFIAPQQRMLSMRDIVYLCLVGLLALGGGIYALLPSETLIAVDQHTSVAIFLLVFSACVLLPSLTLLGLKSSWRAEKVPVVRINREGVLFSRLFGVKLVPVVILWSEMKELIPCTKTTFGSSQTLLGFITYYPDALLKRMLDEQNRNVLARLFIRINRLFFPTLQLTTPFVIPQIVLPISIEELLELIQEQFASELHAYHVRVSSQGTPVL